MGCWRCCELLYRHGLARVGLDLSDTPVSELTTPFKTEPMMPAAHATHEFFGHSTMSFKPEDAA